mmetsp:Transcript_13053/g.45630  ORF Transcript_13053/g.45630 Transcript_13053/m.45630 type:complete len:353 (-) Transcript_13053:29-1087(-)
MLPRTTRARPASSTTSSYVPTTLRGRVLCALLAAVVLLVVWLPSSTTTGSRSASAADAMLASAPRVRAYGPERRCVPGEDAAMVELGHGYGAWTAALDCMELAVAAAAARGDVEREVGALVDVAGTISAAAAHTASGARDALRVKPASVVYSFGLGNNVDFDAELLARFGGASGGGVQVFGFDPTIEEAAVSALVRDTVAQRAPDVDADAAAGGFQFHAWGLGGTDGELSFYGSEDPGIKSLTTTKGLPGYKEAPVLVAPVKRLRTIMAELNHDWVDVLKVDTEGSEFALFLEDADNAAFLPVSELLIEFHNRFEGARGDAKRNAVLQVLQLQGFRIVYTSANGEEVTLLRV